MHEKNGNECLNSIKVRVAYRPGGKKYAEDARNSFLRL